MADEGVNEGGQRGAEEHLAATRARALSSPTRWQVLRLCLEQPRTNKELADLLDVNPGSMLHHVRTLVSTGYLSAQDPRRGARNSLEIPYVATPLTVSALAGISPLSNVLERLLGHPEGEGPWRTTLYLDDPQRDALEGRLKEVVNDYVASQDGDLSAARDGASRWTVVTVSQPAVSTGS